MSAEKTYTNAMRRHAMRARKLGLYSTEIALLAYADMAPSEDMLRAAAARVRRLGGGIYDAPGLRRTSGFLLARAADAAARYWGRR